MKQYAAATLVACLLSLVIYAQPEKPFSIRGNVRAWSKPLQEVVLRYGSHTDSCEIVHGAFRFTGEIGLPGWATLEFRTIKGQDNTIYERHHTEFVLEASVVTFNGVSGTDDQAVIRGSRSETVMSNLQKLAERRINAEVRPMVPSRDSLLKAGDTVAMNRIQEVIVKQSKTIQRRTFLDYARMYPGDPVSLIAFDWGYRAQDDTRDNLKVLGSFPKAVQQSELGLKLKHRLEAMLITKIGDTAPEVAQTDTSGTPVTLSSFKGKYVLLDFWASWCLPCRAENPVVVKAYHAYKDKNFTILAVSLDKPGDKDKWLKAIHEDNLTWTHVSELKFWDNTAVKAYGVNGVPANFLIDPTGKIIAKDLRGDQLEAALKKYLL